MTIHRRDFMKLFGISVASLYLTRCNAPSVQSNFHALTPTPTIQACYMPTAILAPTATPVISSARERLRLYWLCFGELAEKSHEDAEHKFGEELLSGHRVALDELVANGEISTSTADLVQEAYEGAVFHVWALNVPITCYEVPPVYYDPYSAGSLVEQAQILNQIAEEGTIDPDTLAKAQSALEHDLAFYALTDEELQALRDQIHKANMEKDQPLPSFEELSLELSPEVKEATQFIIDLLTSK